jgi:hypothetical protein
MHRVALERIRDALENPEDADEATRHAARNALRLCGPTLAPPRELETRKERILAVIRALLLGLGRPKLEDVVLFADFLNAFKATELNALS